MSQQENNNWLNWEQIEKFLGKKLPFINKEQGQSFLDQVSWVEGYVQDMLKKAMPATNRADIMNNERERTPLDTFETHTHVIVKVKLPKHENPRAIQVLIRSNQIKMLGLLDGDRIIKLPSLVDPKTGRARYKNGILQIQVRKRRADESYHEAYIRF